MNRRPICLLCILYIIGILISDILKPPDERAAAKISPYENEFTDGEGITASGELYKQTSKADKYIIYLKNVTIISNSNDDSISYPINNLIIYLKNQESYQIGNVIQVKGKISFIKSPTNPGQFNAKLYYRIQNVDYLVFNGEAEVINDNYNRYLDYLDKTSGIFKSTMEKIADETHSPILEAMILGDKSDLDTQTSNLYSQSGISHILAISGLHITLIGMGIFKGLRRLGIPFLGSGIISLGIMISYGIMTGLSVSTLRAVIMFIAAVIARILGRTYDLLCAAAFSALFILLENPLYVYHTGFLLSFGAILALGLCLPSLEKLYANPPGLLKGIMASISINLFTLPILLYYFYEFPIYGILLNLIVIPLMTMVLLSGITGCLVGTFFINIGQLLAAPSHYILNLYEYMCLLAQKLPFSVIIIGQPKLWKIIVYYLVLGIIIFVLKKIDMDQCGAWKEKPVRRISIGFLLILVGLLCYNPKNQLEITFLDVGQGDSIFIETPQRTTFLIDGGSTDVSKVGTYRIEPFLKSRGVGSLDYVAITHTDADHMNGVIELYEDYQIKNLVLPYISEKDEKYVELEELAAAKKSNIIYLKSGDIIKTGEVVLTCLHPGIDFIFQDKNEYSLVLVLSYGDFKALFTGDLEGLGEAALLRSIDASTEKILQNLNILKVAHHGSKNSTLAEFLDITSPDLSIISCGKDNSYGHPHEELLNRLQQEDSIIYTTPEYGAITIYTDGKQMQIDTYVKNP